MDIKSYLPSMEWKGSPHKGTSGVTVKGGIDWVVLGGESGPGARPLHPDWVRSVKDQCQEAGVPFFFKQWGEWGVMESIEAPIRKSIAYDPGTGTCRYGKQYTGRLLDGREWSELPQWKNQ
jgi:protein gp37